VECDGRYHRIERSGLGGDVRRRNQAEDDGDSPPGQMVGCLYEAMVPAATRLTRWPALIPEELLRSKATLHGDRFWQSVDIGRFRRCELQLHQKKNPRKPTARIAHNW
jgi:hypothetical protein